MTNTPKNSTGERPSLLGSLLSYEFSECSIAAADLSKQAGDFVVGTGKAVTWYLTEQDTPQQMHGVCLYNEDHMASYKIDGHKTRLYVFQSTERASPERPGTLGRNKLVRFIVRKGLDLDEEQTSETYYNDPFLAVMVGSDTLFPLATFARRESGQCSYVQFGQEMHDDNYHVTTADDESSRFALIEALRVRFNDSGRDQATLSQSNRLIQQFIDQQVELQSEILARARERQLVRQCFNRLARDGSERQLTVLGEDNSVYRGQYRTYPLTPNCILADGRSVGLMLAEGKSSETDEGEESIELMAVTRQEVAVPLAKLSKTFMNFELHGDKDIDPTSKADLLKMILYFVVSYPPSAKMLKEISKPYVAPEKIVGTEQEIARYFLNNHLVIPSELALKRKKLRQPTAPVVKFKLDQFFNYPSGDDYPYPQTNHVGFTAYRLNHFQREAAVVMNFLKVRERVHERMGEARKCDDVLMYCVREIYESKRLLGAIFRDLDIGKTINDAPTSASVTRKDGIYTLELAGRPASLRGEQMVTLLKLDLDPTKPYLGQKKVTYYLTPIMLPS